MSTASKNSIWNALSFLAVLVVAAGVILLLVGLFSTTGGGTGCIFWPFPPVIACGFGGSINAGDGLTTAVFSSTLVLFAAIFLYSLVRGWRSAGQASDAEN